MSTMNLTLLTDFYELTMMQGYFKTQNTEKVVFDAFYRKNPCDGGYAIAAGLDQVIDYIKNLRLDKAKWLLRTEVFSITEICSECGFHDIRTFNKLFKKETGLSPTSFRKNYRM